MQPLQLSFLLIAATDRNHSTRRIRELRDTSSNVLGVAKQKFGLRYRYFSILNAHKGGVNLVGEMCYSKEITLNVLFQKNNFFGFLERRVFKKSNTLQEGILQDCRR